MAILPCRSAGALTYRVIPRLTMRGEEQVPLARAVRFHWDLAGNALQGALGREKLTADNNEHSARLRPAKMLVSAALSPG